MSNPFCFAQELLRLYERNKEVEKRERRNEIIRIAKKNNLLSSRPERSVVERSQINR